jgi:seryl-tRNA synthetase
MQTFCQKEWLMLSLDFLRQHRDIVSDSLMRRGVSVPLAEMLTLAEQRRGLITRCEALRVTAKRYEEAERALSPEEPEEVRRELEEPHQAVRREIRELEIEIAQVESTLQAHMMQVPNVLHASVPLGKDEQNNVEVRRWGQASTTVPKPLPHWELGTRLKLIDFERGAKLAGSRFVVLRGLGARLERALINYMLDMHTGKHGYTEVAPPLLVKRLAMVGTGQLPKFEEDVYLCEEDDLFLIPTAEVPLVNLHRDEILEPGTLPLRYTACTASFRREAGSASRETRGLTRVHQFSKVELVQFVAPDQSYAALEQMVREAEAVLQRLELPYRVALLCAGEVGFSAAKTYDLEVWMPGQQRFVEVASISNCETFQARRANIKYRPAPGVHADFVHTLNASGLAVGRTLAAILENSQQPDGSIVVPQALQAALGVSRIAPGALPT